MQTAPFLASLSPWKSQSLFLCSFLLPFPSSLYLCPSPLSAWSDSFMFILYSVFELFGDLGSINCCSVTKSCPTLHDPMDCSTPGFPALHYLLEFAQVHVHWISDAIQPSHPLCPLLLLPSVFPSIKVFSSESALHISWPKCWSFSLSISPSNEYSGLISFRRTGWISLQSKEPSRVFSNTTVQKHQFFGTQLSL